MNKPETMLQNGAQPRKGKRYFTLADAHRALPLVKRIAADIQRTQADRFRLHSELTALSGNEFAAEPARQLQVELDKQTMRLEVLVDELQKVGVDLKDPARGLLDFPAIHEGREILLCWKAGEDLITAWHEVDTGYAGRRPIDELHGV